MKPFLDIQAQYKAHKAEINQAIQNVLDEGKFIMGPQVRMLEAQLEAYTGSKNCVTCANGTDALQIALMSIGIGSGDEIITTPFTFVATVEAIVLLGAKPVFVDIEEDSFLINSRLIEDKITERTKVIIPVSLYGQIPDMDEINQIAKFNSKKLGHKIYVIEDAAQSFGAEYKGKKSCNVSDIAITSFFPTKPLGCYGDGGAMFTSNDHIAQVMREIRIHGQSKRYYHSRIGVNSRLDTIQAAILLVKLKFFNQELLTRQKNAASYEEEYKDKEIITPKTKHNRTHVFGQYTIRVKDRSRFVSLLKEQGISTAVHYPVPLNKQPAFFDNDADCPIADKLSNEVVSLPMCLYVN